MQTSNSSYLTNPNPNPNPSHSLNPNPKLFLLHHPRKAPNIPNPPPAQTLRVTITLVLARVQRQELGSAPKEAWGSSPPLWPLADALRRLGMARAVGSGSRQVQLQDQRGLGGS